MAQTTALPLETNTHNRCNTPHSLDVLCFYIHCNADIMTTGQIYMIKCVTHLLHVEMHKKEAVIQEAGAWPHQMTYQSPQPHRKVRKWL